MLYFSIYLCPPGKCHAAFRRLTDLPVTFRVKLPVFLHINPWVPLVWIFSIKRANLKYTSNQRQLVSCSYIDCVIRRNEKFKTNTWISSQTQIIRLTLRHFFILSNIESLTCHRCGFCSFPLQPQWKSTKSFYFRNNAEGFSSCCAKQLHRPRQPPPRSVMRPYITDSLVQKGLWLEEVLIKR